MFINVFNCHREKTKVVTLLTSNAIFKSRICSEHFYFCVKDWEALYF